MREENLEDLKTKVLSGKSMIEMLQESDFLSLWKPALDAKKYVLDRHDMKIHNIGDRSAELSTNLDIKWIYVKNNPHAHCDWHHDTVTYLGFIPSYCLNCWKVVVKPQTLVQLYGIYHLQQAMVKSDETCFCKSGIEVRDYVFGNYGAYFYNRSLEEGLKRYAEVREKINHIDKNIPVTLKRYCTEFEMKFGPSNEYKQPEHASHFEKVMDEVCVKVPFFGTQSYLVRTRIMREWIKHAWSVGDPTVVAFTNGKTLGRSCYTYHDKEEKDRVVAQ